MTLSRTEIVERSREYERREPFFEVERDRLETLPAAFEAGDLVWKDVEWIVRWYYRRYLGHFPHERRQELEGEFGGNDWEDVEATMERTVGLDDPGAKVERLLELEGMTVPIASAVLHYLHPDDHLAVGAWTWGVLREAGELDRPYPDPPTVDDYLAYRERCLALAGEFDVDLRTLYRGLWRLARERET